MTDVMRLSQSIIFIQELSVRAHRCMICLVPLSSSLLKIFLLTMSDCFLRGVICELSELCKVRDRVQIGVTSSLEPPIFSRLVL